MKKNSRITWQEQLGGIKPTKAELMERLRTYRTAEAEKLGLVKLRVEMYTTPADKEKALKYLERLKRDV